MTDESDDSNTLAPTDPDELHVVLSDTEDGPAANGAYLTARSATTALTQLANASHAQTVPFHRAERVSVNNRTFIIREYPARYPGEDRQVEIEPTTPVEHPLYDARRWRYVFKITDWTDRRTLDEDGLHATLTYVYAPSDDPSTLGPEGIATIAANGGAQVPEFVLDAARELLEIEGFGRPPFIPERDGETPSEEPRAAGSRGGER